MGFAFSLALVAQVVFTPTPVPAPPASPGTEVFQRERLRYEGDLREACMSEVGIAIVIRNWESRRAGGNAKGGDWSRLENAVGQAAYAEHFDLSAMERAVRAQSAEQARAAQERSEYALEILRQLPPNDRPIYAQTMTVRQVARMRTTCPRERL